MRRTWIAALGAVTLGVLLAVAPAAAAEGLGLEHLGTLDSGSGDAGAEIVAYDPATLRAFVTNGAEQRIDVFDLDDLDVDAPAAPIASIELGGDVQSVTVQDGLGAAAVSSSPITSPGEAVLFDTDTLQVIERYTVGALPDMVTFSPDGKYLVVANEGEPRCTSADPTTATDPEGSVSVIDLSAGPDAGVVSTASFTSFNGQRAALEAEGVRLVWPGATVAEDLEPEYVAVTPDSTTAYVTLQENNALAVVDLASATTTDIVGLGTKDHSVAGNGFDPSNRDDAIDIAPRPTMGMYQPDAIAAADIDGTPYLVTANEGDAREYFADEDEEVLCFIDEARVGDLTLDESVFTDPTLGEDENLGRLNVTRLFPSVSAGGTVPTDGTDPSEVAGLEYSELASFGARSFTIWDAAGNVVWDSGDDLERLVAAENADFFNANFDDADGLGWYELDARSDDKGPEPEAVTVGEAYGHDLAFIGLERSGGFVMYDISNPAEPERITWERSTSVYVDEANALPIGELGDISPEGIWFVPAEDSPTTRPIVLVSYELSGTTSVFEVTGEVAGINLPFDPTQAPEAAAERSVRGTVERLYPAILGRFGDRAGVQYWTSRVESGAITVREAARFMSSASEFQRTYGSVIDRGFVHLMYGNVLGRNGEAGGFTYWNDQLRSGRLDRATVALLFADSPEFVGLLG